MNWVVSLVGCGGPAVSRCGHETRRHRVYGALFASVFASVLLAACGGGSGGNLTTPSEPEPGPPGPGPLTATGDGDGQGSESENEQQQRKIIVNQEEEQEENNNEEQQQITVNVQPELEKEQQQIIIVNQEEEQQQEIVVNIQPEPEEEPEEESEEEEEESEEEEQQQQLTIIEEVVPEYRKPEKPKPTYSAQQQSQPESEEESEEEEEENKEETPQQLTIIEEEVIEFRPPEKPKPTYSTQVGTQQGVQQAAPTEHHNAHDIETGYFGLSYSIWMNNDPTKNNMSFLRSSGSTGDTGRLRMFNDLSDDRTFSAPGLAAFLGQETNLTVTYYKKGGFRGSYHYGGKFGNIVGDVDLRLKFEEDEDIEVTGTLANNVTMGGYNFGNLGINSLDLDEDHGIGTGTVSLGSTTITTNSIEAVLSNRPDVNGRLYAGSDSGGIYVLVERNPITDELDRFIRNDATLKYASKDGYKNTGIRVDMTGYTSISDPLNGGIYDPVTGNRIRYYDIEPDNSLTIYDEDANSIPVSELTDWFDLGRKIVVEDNGCDCSTRYSFYWDSEPNRLAIQQRGQYKIHLPNRIAGEIKTSGFKHSDDTESTASKNALYGVFIGEVHGKKPVR